MVQTVNKEIYYLISYPFKIYQENKSKLQLFIFYTDNLQNKIFIKVGKNMFQDAIVLYFYIFYI